MASATIERLEAAIDEAISEKIDEVDFGGAIDEALKAYDLENAIQDAVESYDLEKAIRSAVDDYNLDDAINDAFKDFGIDRAIERELEMAVANVDLSDKAEAAVAAALDRVLPGKVRETFLALLKDEGFLAKLSAALFEQATS